MRGFNTFIMSRLKLLASAGSAVAKASWLSRVFSGSKALLSGAGRFLSNPWVSAAFLAWEVYDYFDTENNQSDPGSIVANVGRQKDLNSVMYPPAVLRALTSGISDSNALSLAFTNAFLRSSSSTDALARLRSTAYATMADYLLKAPDLNSIIYSSDQTSDALSEISEVIASELSDAEKEEVLKLDLSAEDVASSPIESRKVLDFTAHMLNIIKEQKKDE